MKWRSLNCGHAVLFLVLCYLFSSSVGVKAVNVPPLLGSLDGDPVTFLEDGSGVFLDAGGDATLTDSDSPDFDGGSVTVSITQNRAEGEDVLSIEDFGALPGFIGLSGSTVTFGGLAIGTAAGGTGTNDLVVSLNTNSTPAAVEALLRALAYRNSNDTNPSPALRLVAVTIDDGDGGTATGVVTLTVTPVNDPPIVSAPVPDQAGTYGAVFSFTLAAGTFSDPDGDLMSYSATGLPPGLSLTSSNLTLSGTPTNPGSYSVSVVASDGGMPPLTATNQFQFVVSKAILAVVALDQARVYGTNNPPLTISYAGFVAGDTAGLLTNPPVASTTASNRSPVGIYPIALSSGADYRYDFFLTNGLLTVSKAVLKAQAEDKVKVPIAPVPALTVSYVGFAPGETPAVLDVLPTPATVATSGSAPGTYPITLTGGSDDNYDLVLTDGTLTVRAAGVPRITGTFYGLFYESSSVRNDRSGSLTLTTRDGDTFSAALRTAGRKYSFSGRFDVDGRATNQVARKNDFPVNVELQIGGRDGIDQLGGRVADIEDAWSADLLARVNPYNSSTNPAPQAGKYTLSMPGQGANLNEPFGHGYAMVSVGKQGKADLTLRLADGTAATQGLYLTSDGIWPWYVPLYSGQGSVIGWLSFTNLSTSDLNGQMNWVRPGGPLDKPYPAGFSITRTVYGARFTAPPHGQRIINLPDCILGFSGGILFFPVSSAVQLGTDNRLHDLTGTNLPVKIHKSNGQITGQFLNPFGGEIVPFKGILIQKTNVAAGYFMAPGNSSGRMELLTNSP